VREIACAKCARPIVLAALLALSGCAQDWQLSIVSASNGRPEFGFSRDSRCPGRPVYLASIDVARVDASRHPVETLWAIEKVPDGSYARVPDRIVYGQVSAGWLNDEFSAFGRITSPRHA
jgi:hypothetical protein